MQWMLALALALAFFVPAMATEFRSGNTVTIPAGQVIDDDLVVSGSQIEMYGRVTGDLVVAAGHVDVAGPVAGDLIVLAGEVTVTQPIGGSIYAAAGNVTLSAPVGRNVLAAAGTVMASEDAAIGRDLLVNGGEVTINSRVARNVRGEVGDLTLASGAVIGGDVAVQAKRYSIAEGATIQGEEQITQLQRHGGRSSAVLKWFFGQLLFALSLLIVGLVWAALAPRLTEETTAALRRRPGISLLVGAIIFLLALPLFILPLLTIIGIPIALIWSAAYLMALFISPLFPAILIGRRLWRGARGNLLLAVLLGVGLLLVAQLIPFFGGLLLFIAALFGLGALALALYGRTQRRAPTADMPPEAPPAAA